MNITKLKVWPQLAALGFEPINFNAHGRKIATGAALQREVVSISGEKFKTDIICIEPHSFQYSNRRYHITGEVKTPYTAEFYRYNEIGRKEKLFQTVDHINEFFQAAAIMPTIQKMLK